jgi:hypothetical protein
LPLKNLTALIFTYDGTVQVEAKMKRFVLIALVALGSVCSSLVPAHAGTYCADGTYSVSSGSGTCSWHGGILGGAPSKSKSYGSTLNNDPYGLNSYGSTKSKSYGSTLDNDPYGLNSYGSTKSKSYGSTLNNDPYGLNSYGSKVKPCYSLRC